MAFDTTTLDAPFAALAGFDWGADATPLAAIDAAVVAAHADAALAGDLEKRLGAIVSGPASRAAKEYACRRLAVIASRSSGLSPITTSAVSRISPSFHGRSK